jgi:hypothetical protein
MNPFGLSKSLIQAARDVHAEGMSPDKNVPKVPVKGNSPDVNLRKREKEIAASQKANVQKEEAVAEALKGGQKKLDKNHNGKLDSQDFKMLRKEETVPFEGPYEKKGEAKTKNVAKNAARKALKKVKSSMDKVKTGGAVREEVELDEETINQIEEELYNEIMSEGMNYHSALNKTHQAITAAKKHIQRGSSATPAQRARAHVQHSFLQRHAEYLRKKIASSSKNSSYKPTPGKYKKSMREEVEQVDEVSKATLGSYIKKASVDAIKQGKIAHLKKHSLAISRKPEKHDDQKAKEIEKINKKAQNRLTGISKATDRLTKEEVEQVDEVSKATLGSYVKKASVDVKKHGFDSAVIKYAGGKQGSSKHREKMSKEFNKVNHKATNRLNGISKATDRLTKEEVQFSPEELERIEAIVGTNK